MNRILIAMLATLLVMGCATSPKSIQAGSSLAISMEQAKAQDTLDIIKYMSAETKLWREKAFGLALDHDIATITDANGNVNLAQLREVEARITKAYAEQQAEADADEAAIAALVQAKSDKQMLLLFLIDQYEKEAGVSPESIEQLVEVLGKTAKGVMDYYDQEKAKKAAAEAAEPLDFKDKMNLFAEGLFDKAYAEVQTKYKDKPLLPEGGFNFGNLLKGSK